MRSNSSRCTTPPWLSRRRRGNASRGYTPDAGVIHTGTGAARPAPPPRRLWLLGQLDLDVVEVEGAGAIQRPALDLQILGAGGNFDAGRAHGPILIGSDALLVPAADHL